MLYSIIITVILAAFIYESRVVLATVCPIACLCNDVPNDDQLQVFTHVTCTNLTFLNQLPNTTYSLKLTRIPDDINLQVLIDDITNISQHLPNLNSLSLSGCSLDNLDDISFIGLYEYLRVLDLSNNLISDLPLLTTASELQLFNLTKLIKLDLSANRFQTIIDDTYSDFTNLQILNLSANRLCNLSTNSFNGLTELQYLDLSSNNLTVIGGNVFSQLVQLQYLNLSNNKIETLEDNCFSPLTKLQQLDVSHNQLTSVEPSALQALPSLARLTLAGNPHLGDLLVGTGRRLQAVDASGTGLAHVPPALTRSVRTLRLAGNSIHAVRCGDLDSYPLLQLLDFAGNSLENIEEDALGRLDTLFMLYLSENCLRVMPSSLPTSLKILHLERNKIEQLKIGQLNGLINLEVLLLSDNDISILEEGVFDDLKSLVTLDISGNPLIALGGGVLSSPSRLQVLRLAGLPVATVARDTSFPVHAPERLVSLDLTASPGLARMLLADVAALSAARYLQELSLADAGLVHLRHDLLQYLPQLRSLRLSGNRLDCSRLLWLAEWMRQQNRDEDRAVLCAAPPDLAGTQLIDLQENDIAEIYNAPEMTTTTVISQTSKYIALEIDDILNNKLNSTLTNIVKDEISPANTRNIPTVSNNTEIINDYNLEMNTSTEQFIKPELNNNRNANVTFENVSSNTNKKLSLNTNQSGPSLNQTFQNVRESNESNQSEKISTIIGNPPVIELKSPLKIKSQKSINQIEKNITTPKYNTNRTFYANDSTSAKILRDLFTGSERTVKSDGKVDIKTEEKTRSSEKRHPAITKINENTEIQSDETTIQLQVVSEPKFILSPVIKESLNRVESTDSNITQPVVPPVVVSTAVTTKESNQVENDTRAISNTGEMSMYRRTTSALKTDFSEHPGMLVLVAALIGVTLTVIFTIVTRWSSCQRNRHRHPTVSAVDCDDNDDEDDDLRHHHNYHHHTDSIEVNHLPGVTDLW